MTFELRFDHAPDFNADGHTSTISLFCCHRSLGTKTTAASVADNNGNWIEQSIDLDSHISEIPTQDHYVSWKYSSGGDASRVRYMRIVNTETGQVWHDQYGGDSGETTNGVGIDGGGAAQQYDVGSYSTLNGSGDRVDHAILGVELTEDVLPEWWVEFDVAPDNTSNTDTAIFEVSARPYAGASFTTLTPSTLETAQAESYVHAGQAWERRAIALTSATAAQLIPEDFEVRIRYTSGNDGVSVRNVTLHHRSGASVSDQFIRQGWPTTTLTGSDAGGNGQQPDPGETPPGTLADTGTAYVHYTFDVAMSPLTGIGDYHDEILADAPVLYLPLDDGSGTTARALAGAPGTYVGSPTFRGAHRALDGTISTDGTNDEVTLRGPTLGTTQAQTWELWFHTATAINSGTTGKRLITPALSPRRAIQLGTFSAGLTNEVITVSNDSGSDTNTGWSGFTIPAGWHHLALTYSGTQNGWTCYLDGEDVTGSTWSGTKISQNSGASGLTFDSAAALASDQGSGFVSWSGLAALAVYDTALSSSRISAHYNVVSGYRTSYDQAVINSGPRYYLPLHDGQTTGPADALVGSDGTLNGGIIPSAGPSLNLPRALDHDGSDDYVATASITLGNTQPQTWEIWTHYDGTIDSSSNWRLIYNGDNGSQIGFGNISTPMSNEVCLISHSANTVQEFTYWTGSSVPKGWHHHVWTYTGSQGGWTWYIDGVDATDAWWGFTKNQNLSGSRGLPTKAYNLGRTSTIYTDWDGMAGLAVYPRVLDLDEIRHHRIVGANLSIIDQATEEAGAVLSWPLDDPDDAVTALAVVGPGGDYVGTPDRQDGPDAQDMPRAVSTNGTSSYVRGLVSLDFTTTYSVECWFKAIAGTTKGTLVAAHDGSSKQRFMLWLNSTGQVHAEVYQTSGSTTLNTTDTWLDGLWHHVVLVVGASNAEIWIDGVQEAGPTALGTPTSGTYDDYVSTLARYDNSSGRSDADFADADTVTAGVAIYDDPLTQAQIEAHHSYGRLWRGGSPLLMS